MNAQRLDGYAWGLITGAFLVSIAEDINHWDAFGFFFCLFWLIISLLGLFFGEPINRKEDA